MQTNTKMNFTKSALGLVPHVGLCCNSMAGSGRFASIGRRLQSSAYSLLVQSYLPGDLSVAVRISRICARNYAPTNAGCHLEWGIDTQRTMPQLRSRTVASPTASGHGGVYLRTCDGLVKSIHTYENGDSYTGEATEKYPISRKRPPGSNPGGRFQDSTNAVQVPQGYRRRDDLRSLVKVSSLKMSTYPFFTGI